MPDGRSPEEARMVAAIALLRRTGATSFQLRYSDDEDPVIWMAVGEWHIADGRPVPAEAGGEIHYDAAAAADPPTAVMRLLDEKLDGGQCTHCGRPSTVLHEPGEVWPLDGATCAWRYDPERGEYVRGCADVDAASNGG